MELKKRILLRAQTRPLRIGVYVRVSTKEQATEGVSLEAQQSIADRHLQQWRHDKVMIGAITYYVEARSGKDFIRPEMKRLHADVQAGRIDLILAYKMDRIGRHTVDFRNFETPSKHMTWSCNFSTTGTKRRPRPTSSATPSPSASRDTNDW